MSESFTSGSVGGLAGNRRLYPEELSEVGNSDFHLELKDRGPIDFCECLPLNEESVY
jgi:hypothetical protein